MKTWCKHIKWQLIDLDGCEGWVFKNPDIVAAIIKPSGHWKLCPVCGAPRPTRANINSAKLRFDMDNDQ
jgi:hypothetical protein